MLYTATHNDYSDVTGHSTGETRSFGSLKAARKWAKAVLPKVATVSDENYHRDMARMSTVDILSKDDIEVTVTEWDGFTYTCRKPAHAETVTPEIQVVPSAGQLGYW